MSFTDFYYKRYNQQAFDFGDASVCFGMRENASDISAHLPVLELFARMSSSVTEFGSRCCYSTCAFLRGCKDVRSYDINLTNDMKELDSFNLGWKYFIQDTASETLQIEQTDFLFIDTLHTYDQVRNELRQAKYVNKFIGFHDTVSQGEYSRDIPGAEGINRAIREFMQENPNWKSVYEAVFNHGLIVLANGNNT
jgi:DNA-dependent RNA polymerase auxiliary subunit epsilon